MEYKVYFIQCGTKKGAPVKIGVTSNIDKRLAALQTSSPWELVVKALLPCESKSEAYSLEGFLHHRLKRFKIRGEWFRSGYFEMKKILGEFNRVKDTKVTLVNARLSAGEKGKISNLEYENRKLKARVKALESQIDEYLDENQMDKFR